MVTVHFAVSHFAVSHLAVSHYLTLNLSITLTLILTLTPNPNPNPTPKKPKRRNRKRRIGKRQNGIGLRRNGKTRNGWPHNALRYHQLIPISCHFRDCKALLVKSRDVTDVSGTISTTQTFTLYLLSSSDGIVN